MKDVIPVTHRLEFIPIFWIEVFVISAVLLFALTGACIVYWTTQSAFNSKRITDAQVKVYEAQAENVGKPTIIRQEYISPMKGQ